MNDDKEKVDIKGQSYKLATDGPPDPVKGVFTAMIVLIVAWVVGTLLGAATIWLYAHIIRDVWNGGM